MSSEATYLSWRWAEQFILDINQLVLLCLTSHVSLQHTAT